MRSGRAIEAAPSDYRNAARKRTAQRTLPDAWAKLVESEDYILVELLSDKVEDLCGVKPGPDAVAAFLRGQASDKTAKPPVAVPKRTEQTVQPPVGSDDVPRSVGYTLDGHWHPAKSAREVMAKVFDELAKRDPTFLERFAALPKHGRKRRYLPRTKEELYPGSPHLVINAHQLRPGWWCDPHASRAGIARRIRMACEVAEMRYGEDLTINLG